MRCSAACTELQAVSSSIANASNNSVNRECLSAHGGATVFTPHVGQSHRGSRAANTVVNCIVSRCRQ